MESGALVRRRKCCQEHGIENVTISFKACLGKIVLQKRLNKAKPCFGQQANRNFALRAHSAYEIKIFRAMSPITSKLIAG